MFTAEYADRLSQDTTIGAGGTAAPMGIFTRMAATTTNSAHVTVTTAGSIRAADVRAVWAALPERAKSDPSCAWIMSNSVWSQITALGAPSVTDGLEPGAVQYPVGNAGPRLYGEPVIFSSYAPAFTGTTGAANYLVVGAFQRYAIAQRVGGSTVELIPQVPDFSGSYGMPTGNRGFLAIARFGADVLDRPASACSATHKPRSRGLALAPGREQSRRVTAVNAPAGWRGVLRRPPRHPTRAGRKRANPARPLSFVPHDAARTALKERVSHRPRQRYRSGMPGRDWGLTEEQILKLPLDVLGLETLKTFSAMR